MKRILMIAVLISMASVAEAQFLGDSLAAAGFNVTEDQADAALAAISAKIKSTTAAKAAPAPAPPPKPAASNYEAIPALPAVTGTGYSVPGGGRAPSAEDAAAWKAAWRAVGTSVTAPPQGSDTIDDKTRYFKGVFYQKRDKGWVVVPAPAGARVTERPAPATTVTAAQRPYLYYNGAFFVWNASAHAYEVVPAPAGAVVAAIPESAVKNERGGTLCYEYGTTCFVPAYRGTSLVYQVGDASSAG